MTRLLGLSVLLLTAAPVGSAAPVPPPAEAPRGAQAAQSNDSWCDDAHRNYDDNRETFCEVREFTLGRGALALTTSNGSVRVTGERRGDILVRARVVAYARDAARASEIGRDIAISTSGTIKATGPRTGGVRFRGSSEGWHVSFRVQAPESTDLELRSSNGSLGVTGVRGRLTLRTSNGSIRLDDVAGDVRADTSNGSVNTTLSGTTWEGEGLDVGTSNGSVRLTVPEGYNARLVAGTSNGTITIGFPVTVQGRIAGGRSRDIDTTLGSGGPTLRVRTSNGSVRLERR